MTNATTRKTKKKEETIELAFPIEFGGETVTQIVVKRPKFKHLKFINDMDSITGDEFGQLLSKLTGQPSDVIDELDAEDLEEIGEVVEGFLKRGKKTGKKKP